VTSTDGTETAIIAASGGLLLAMVALGLWRFKHS
jgi:LPXTG-motif cell wall-anchored protein